MSWIVILGIPAFFIIKSLIGVYIEDKKSREKWEGSHAKAQQNKVTDQSSATGTKRPFDELADAGLISLLRNWNLVQILPPNAINLPVQTEAGEFSDYIEYMQSERKVLDKYEGVINNLSVRVFCFDDCLVTEVPANSTEAVSAIIAPDPSCFEEVDPFLQSMLQTQIVIRLLETLHKIEEGTPEEDSLTIDNTILMDAFNITLWAAKSNQ